MVLPMPDTAPPAPAFTRLFQIRGERLYSCDHENPETGEHFRREMEFLDYYLHAAGAALGMEEAAFAMARAGGEWTAFRYVGEEHGESGKPAVVYGMITNREIEPPEVLAELR